MVTALDMRLFVGDHMAKILFLHVIGQIDVGFDDAQDKGGCYIFALEDVVPEDHSLTDFAPQPPVADSGINEERRNTYCPDDRQNGNPYLKRISTGSGCRRKGLADHRIDHAIDSGYAGLDRWRLFHHNAGADGLSAGDQAQRTLNGEGTDQPDRNNGPEQHIDPLGRLLQGKSEQQHRQNDPTGRYAHVYDFQKQVAHHLPPFRMRSIMRCTSSSSSSEIS